MAAILRPFSVAIVCVSMAMLGCQTESDEFRTAGELEKAGELGPEHGHDDHGHTHGDHGHGDHDHGDHGHDHVAPHAGALVMLGDHVAQVEFVLDAEAGKLTVYLLDGEAEKALKVDQAEIQATLTVPPALPDDEAQEIALTLSAGESDGEFVAESEVFHGPAAFSLALTEIKIGEQDFTSVKFSKAATPLTDAPEVETPEIEFPEG